MIIFVILACLFLVRRWPGVTDVAEIIQQRPLLFHLSAYLGKQGKLWSFLTYASVWPFLTYASVWPFHTHASAWPFLTHASALPFLIYAITLSHLLHMLQLCRFFVYASALPFSYFCFWFVHSCVTSWLIEPSIFLVCFKSAHMSMHLMWRNITCAINILVSLIIININLWIKWIMQIHKIYYCNFYEYIVW